MVAHELEVGGLEICDGISGEGILECEGGEHGEDVGVVCCYAGDVVEGCDGADWFWDDVYGGGGAGVVLGMLVEFLGGMVMRCLLGRHGRLRLRSVSRLDLGLVVVLVRWVGLLLIDHMLVGCQLGHLVWLFGCVCLLQHRTRRGLVTMRPVVPLGQM